MTENSPEQQTPARDPEVSEAIERARKAQEELLAIVKQNQLEAFDALPAPARVDKTVTETHFFDQNFVWTDAAGSVQACNAVRVDRVTTSAGEESVRVYAAVYFGDPQTATNPAANPMAELPVEVAERFQ